MKIFKSLTFILLLCLLGWLLPLCMTEAWPEQGLFSIVAGVFVLLLGCLAAWLLHGRFFAETRTQLCPVWHAAVLAWLVPVVAMAFVATVFWELKDARTLPFFGGVFDYHDAWTVPFHFAKKKMLLIGAAGALLAVLTRSGIFSRRMYGFMRFLLLTFFGVTCARIAYSSIDAFDLCFGTTWAPGESWDELFVPYTHYLAVWIGLALMPAWFLTGDCSSVRERPVKAAITQG